MKEGAIGFRNEYDRHVAELYKRKAPGERANATAMLLNNNQPPHAATAF